jgi:hypothetical protein
VSRVSPRRVIRTLSRDATRFARRVDASLRFRIAKALLRERFPEDLSILDMYATEAPSPRLAAEIFEHEWSSALPPELGLAGGSAALFDDPRITAVLAWLDRPATGLSALDLGPLEGGHTSMLERAGADVVAVEANSRAYLKCLIVKELLGLHRAHFLRGDFVEYLRTTDRRFDLALASGVLYHSNDPLQLLELLSRVSDRIAIWTHYFDAAALEGTPAARHFTRAPEIVSMRGRSYVLHPRDYLESLRWHGFCGGPESDACWLERDGLLDALRDLGFADLTVSHEVVHHPNGPSLMVLAKRS